jgi:hypothetical protein
VYILPVYPAAVKQKAALFSTLPRFVLRLSGTISLSLASA